MPRSSETIGTIAASLIAVSLLLFTPHYLDRVLTAFEGASVLELRETRQATYAVVVLGRGRGREVHATTAT